MIAADRAVLSGHAHLFFGNALAYGTDAGWGAQPSACSGALSSRAGGPESLPGLALFDMS
ncbi:hypothetical protein K9B35_00130 [Sphingomonas sp. R647]|uniref:hypothetical protein n=1 Tax=Sphingomonas sp. R647 TaxID=2875233 RepID=UPI001CD7F5EE|nr:hypothetical protein [Sphingomonas sp. R647]MCA1196361.1 hypothetical protein [Sphingomonas sp. R647]